MKLNIVAVGKIKETYFTEAVAEYAKRLSRFCAFTVTEVPETAYSKEPTPGEAEKIKREEGDRILERLSGYVVALDLAGSALTSVQFSEFLSERMTEGKSSITFVIGGSYGLSSRVLDRADYRLCFGAFTYPHQLMRVILTEQLYRAFMLRSGSAYHK